MGAIAGVMPRSRELDRDRLTIIVSAMRDAMERRAPLEGGMAVAYDASIALAHRGGTGPGSEAVLQPLSNESGTLWLVADGEPSNAAELRLELVAAGHSFQSACGSETIVHLYEQDGPAALERLAGGFAFALWDREKHELVLGRDRFGERPLYFVDDAGRFSFASEVRALSRAADIDPAALVALLSVGFLVEPMTAASGVRAVAPGSIMRVRGARSSSERLWTTCSFEPTGAREGDRARLGAMLRDAVQAAVHGQEEVGIVLDGSVESGALLTLVRPMLGQGLRTHGLDATAHATASPSDRVMSLRPPSPSPLGALAGWFHTEYRAHEVGPASLAAAFQLAAESDQPSVGGALAQLTAAFVRQSGERVWLAPLAHPELVGWPDAGAISWLWRTARHHASCALARVGSSAIASARPFGRAAAVAGYLRRGESVATAYLAARGLLAPTAMAGLVRGEVLAHAWRSFDAIACLDERALRPPGPTFTGRMPSARAAVARAVGAIDLAGPLMSGALRDAESAAAANGLALRLPFLDHRLVEWIAAGGLAEQVAPLAEVLRSAAPRPVTRRFATMPPLPIESWMRGELRPVMEAHLFDTDHDGLFNRAGVERLWASFRAGRADWRAVWLLAGVRAWIGARRSAAAARHPERRRAAA